MALVLTGIADVALFAFANVDQAKLAASILGISTMAVIALSWAGLLFARRQEAAASGKKQVMAFLLLAFFYVFANACVVFLSDERWVREVVAWANVVLGLVFAVIYTVLTPKRCAPSTTASDRRSPAP